MTVDTQKLRELLTNRQSGWPFPSDQALVEQFPALVDEIEALRAEKERAERNGDMWKGQCERQAKQLEATRWQPIETAPKSGRTLLLGYFNSHGKWRTVRGEWMSEEYIAEHWEDPDGVEPGWFETSVEADDTPNCWRIEPTYWQPLPLPPGRLQGDGA